MVVFLIRILKDEGTDVAVVMVVVVKTVAVEITPGVAGTFRNQYYSLFHEEFERALTVIVTTSVLDLS